MTTHTHRTIAHFDLDSFFVSVERLKNPSLVGKPIAVGGHSDRGVVASCSYEARKFGVRSAMPTRQARKLCPDIIMVPGDMSSYSTYSREVTQIIADHVPLFEKSSIDEFYIDMTGMDKFFGTSKYTAELRRTITKKTGLTISYGLSTNKLVSKVATNEAKPNGTLEVPPGTERAFLAPMPIEKLPMIGKKTSATLRSIGIDTLGELANAPIELLNRVLGKSGSYFWNHANGYDDSPVVPYHESKSIGTENTFHADSDDMNFLEMELTRMTEKIAFELRESNRLAGCITIKIRYHDFETVTRQVVIPYSSADHLLLQTVRQLFAKHYNGNRPIRLLGVRFSHLVPGNYQIDLFNDTTETVNLYQAIDHIKHRFGENMLIRAAGALFTGPKNKEEE